MAQDQVPRKQVVYLISGYFVDGFSLYIYKPYIHTAYIAHTIHGTGIFAYMNG